MEIYFVVAAIKSSNKKSKNVHIKIKYIDLTVEITIFYLVDKASLYYNINVLQNKSKNRDEGEKV